MFKATIATGFAVLLTALPALLQGQLLNRWSSPPSLSKAGLKLHDFPRKLGPWGCTEDERPLAEAVCLELGLENHFHRQYVHSETGERVSVLLMVGPPGRLVRHPPDVCYANRANRQLGPASLQRVQNKAADHEFHALQFKRIAQPMEREFWIAYAYSTDTGTWSAPLSPRMEFGGAPVLYKLQVLSEHSAFRENEPSEDFLHRFVDAFPAVIANTPSTHRSSDGL